MHIHVADTGPLHHLTVVSRDVEEAKSLDARRESHCIEGNRRGKVFVHILGVYKTYISFANGDVCACTSGLWLL